jgi:hypothetical protein
MASSGIPWIDATFNSAVRALYLCADFLGITYEEINVWLFCVAWPVATLVMFVMLVKLWRTNRELRVRIPSGPTEQSPT